MVLTATTLAAEITTLVNSPPEDLEDARQLYAEAFSAYMKQISFPVTTPGQHNTAKDAFVSVLTTGYGASPAGLVELQNAHVAYVASIFSQTVGAALGQSVSPPVGLPLLATTTDLASYVSTIDVWVRTGVYVVSPAPFTPGPWT